nr:PKD domain-containing protein [Bacteroidota bacterium]
MLKKLKIKLLAITLQVLYFSSYSQTSGCDNLDFSRGNFNNWVGHTSVYPPNTPGTNINIPYYYNTGIVPGRQTIISTSIPDPYTCNNVMTLPPGLPFCARLGNGGQGSWGDGVDWERDYLSYTMLVSPSNTLLTYKYAVVLQDPNKDVTNPPHPNPIRPRFVVSILDAAGKPIDPKCAYLNVVVDSTVAGFRDCPYNDLIQAGGNPVSPSGTVYRAWTSVGVDLRQFIGQNITLQFETWDCGLGAHFGYAYVTARCDVFKLQAQVCTNNGSVLLKAPEGFSYKWFPGGQTTKDINIFNANPGDTVYVEMTTLTGCKTTIGTRIYPTVIVANFKVNPTVVCLKDPISFNDSSSSHYTGNNSSVPIVKWDWRFGDGTSISSTKNTTHTYATAGTFTVNLTITNANGCVDSIKKTVQVIPAPKANFVLADICVNSKVNFTDISQAVAPQVITNWIWTFKDDNTTSILQNASHLYTVPGVYTITLAVKTDKGCVNDTSRTVKIWPLPKANFTAKEVCIGDTSLFFDKSLPSDPADNIVNWVWNFGDNSALSSSKNCGHVYLKDGSYKVRLIVGTARGCVKDTVIDVVVHPTPKANFVANPVCKGSPITFQDKSTPVGIINGWQWNFGDNNNNFSNLQNPSHTYDSIKIYYPKLIIVSKYGCSDTIVIPVNIPPLPEISFDANKYEGCSPLCINFMDQSFTSSDPITKWDWTFGDGESSTKQSPPHCYLNPGIYTVSLTIQTANSCKQSKTWVGMIKVYPHPVANFDANPYETGESSPVINFDEKATGATVWRWTFGDNQAALARDTSHTYKKAGKYTVWLYVKNQYGCVDSIAKDI